MITSPAKEKMLDNIARLGAWNGYGFQPLDGAGREYFVAEALAVDASGNRSILRFCVHVALDGSIRYSDSERFGELWSCGVSG